MLDLKKFDNYSDNAQQRKNSLFFITLTQGFPTFYLCCPPKAKISNVASPQEEVVPALKGLNIFKCKNSL